MERLLCRVSEVAEFLGVSKAKVYELVEHHGSSEVLGLDMAINPVAHVVGLTDVHLLTEAGVCGCSG